MATVIKLYRSYKPLAFFGIIAIILLLLSLGFFIPVLATYVKTGLVPNFPTLIVCGFTAVSGLLSLFTGLQLQSFVQKSKQDFELARIRANADFRNMCEK